MYPALTPAPISSFLGRAVAADIGWVRLSDYLKLLFPGDLIDFIKGATSEAPAFLRARACYY